MSNDPKDAVVDISKLMGGQSSSGAVKINSHGIRMTGLKKASGNTKTLRGYHSGEYVELFFNRATGEVWTKYQYSLGQNARTVYDDANVVKVGNFFTPTTMQEIAAAIIARLNELA